MKQQFLIKKGNAKLLIIFGGWGTWPGLFSSAPFREDEDVLLCWDYRTQAFDRSMLEGYAGIRLLAWSMGVWEAARTFEGKEYPWAERIAIGGTLYPIDDAKGIPKAIFQGTLDNMSIPVLAKFRRRMCGKDQEQFMSLNPDRPITELKEELAAIALAVDDYQMQRPAPEFTYDKAIIGRNDMIFPAANQRAAWEGRTRIIETEGCHYDAQTFDRLISGRLWD